MTAEPHGGMALPRKKREDFTWRSVYFPTAWLPIILSLAQKEDRSLSSMLRQLLRDGLTQRGIAVPEPPPEYDEEGH